MFLPDIFVLPNAHTPCTAYLGHAELDYIRIHVFIDSEGTADPVLFVGSSMYRIER